MKQFLYKYWQPISVAIASWLLVILIKGSPQDLSECVSRIAGIMLGESFYYLILRRVTR